MKGTREMRREMRSNVWCGKNLNARPEEFCSYDSLYTPTSNRCTHVMIAFEAELWPQF